MGSGSSRGKKVAPAVVCEVRVSKAGGAGVHPSPRAGGPLSQHKVHCAQPESRGEGPRSDDGTGRRGAPPRKRFTRPRTYGLCPFSGGHAEDEPRLEEPRVPRSVDVNKGNDCAFTHRKQLRPAGFIRRRPATLKLPAGGTFLERAPTFGKQQTSGSGHGASAAILYDGSEEELMDTIEREFS